MRPLKCSGYTCSNLGNTPRGAREMRCCPKSFERPGPPSGQYLFQSRHNNRTREFFDIKYFRVPVTGLNYVRVCGPPPLPSDFATLVSGGPVPQDNEFVHAAFFYLSSTPSGVCGWKARYARARMTPIVFLRQLYSLDTLDTRFTTPARTPLKAANADPAQPVKPEAGKLSTTLPAGASPSRWRTTEYYVYAVVFIVCLPQMFKAVVDVSRCKYRLA
jgi:hypothetical protein